MRYPWYFQGAFGCVPLPRKWAPETLTDRNLMVPRLTIGRHSFRRSSLPTGCEQHITPNLKASGFLWVYITIQHKLRTVLPKDRLYLLYLRGRPASAQPACHFLPQPPGQTSFINHRTFLKKNLSQRSNPGPNTNPPHLAWTLFAYAASRQRGPTHLRNHTLGRE